MLRNLALAGLFALLAAPAFADDKKETKLEGELACPKCVLKEKGVTECGNALKVKEGDKTVVYFLKDKGKEEGYHKDCCTKAVAATITGAKVVEKDGKKWLEGGKVEVKK